MPRSKKQSSCRQIPNPCLLAVPNKGGFFYPMEKSGIGITFDEEAAADFPVVYRPMSGHKAERRMVH